MYFALNSGKHMAQYMLDVALRAQALKLNFHNNHPEMSGSGPLIRVHSGFTLTQHVTHPTSVMPAAFLHFCCELKVPIFALTTEFVEDFGKPQRNKTILSLFRHFTTMD
jgi:hypothetical protein